MPDRLRYRGRSLFGMVVSSLPFRLLLHHQQCAKRDNGNHAKPGRANIKIEKLYRMTTYNGGPEFSRTP